MSTARRSAYGLNFDGLGAPPDLLGDPLPAAPTITVRWHVDATVPAVTAAEVEVDGERAVIRHPAGVRIELDRAGRTADFHGREIPPDQRAHPLLSPVGVVHNRWLGREVFHAGVVEIRGRAWVLTGRREAGKSTLVAALAARGLAVLADDIAVTDGRAVFRGPRCVDLREFPPDGLLDPRVLDNRATVRNDTRFRLPLPAAAAAVPLGGWVALDWSGEMSVARFPAGQVLKLLARRRMLRDLDSDETLLLDLARRPALRLQRPRDWAQAPASLDVLLAAVGDVDEAAGVLDAAVSR